jgi:4-alpha-glucanotransferase
MEKLKHPRLERKANNRPGSTFGSLARFGNRASSRRRPMPFRGGRANHRHQANVRALAKRSGIQTSYLDMWNHRREASTETLVALLRLWGVNAQTEHEIEAATRELEAQHGRRVVEPVVISWDGQPTRVEIRLPAGFEAKAVRCDLRLEAGERRKIDCELSRARSLTHAALEGSRFVVRQVALPLLPSGYHELEIEVAGQVFRSLVISAPRKSYSPQPVRRGWGIFLPMYAAHSQRSWGAGNLSDWARLSQWASAAGADVIATLPLLAAFLDAPRYEPSPYSPASRLFWNEFYVDVEGTPEFAHCRAARKIFESSAFQARLAAFRRNPMVDYRAEMAARRRILEPLSAHLVRGAQNSRRRKSFERFVRERPLVNVYAAFRAACEKTGAPWPRWEKRMRAGELRPGDFSPATRDYHLYVQFVAQEQMAALSRRCERRGLRFYLDLPLGVHPDGFDVWHERDVFALGASVGAPPDVFFSLGQNWGFPPVHPERIRNQGYRYLRDYLHFQMRQAGILRIDHVMGLHRLYWIPPGFPADQGAYVTYPAEELYAILSLESHRHQTILVGENLGTVPAEVNRAMGRHGLRQTYVMQFAQRPNPRRALEAPPANSVASLDTHDTPTFFGRWLGDDIEIRKRLEGGKTRRLYSNLRAEREKLNRALLAFLNRACSRYGEPRLPRKDASSLDRAEMMKALGNCLGWMASSSAEIVLANLEDLWLERQPQNVPGTSKEFPNWRRKTRLTIEQIIRSHGLRRILRHLRRG